jgi:hypothetical protein
VAFAADLRAVGGDLEGPTDGLGPYRVLPLDEALDRLLKETGFAAPRSRQLEQRGLSPVFVAIIAGPVLEEGTVWGVYLTYGDGPTLQDSRSRIDLVRYGFADHGPTLPAQQWPWGAPSASGRLLSNPINISHEPTVGLSPRVYTGWGGASRFIVRLADRGDSVLLDDSLAIAILLDLAGTE